MRDTQKIVLGFAWQGRTVEVSDTPGPELREVPGLQAVRNQRREHGKAGESMVHQPRKRLQKCQLSLDTEGVGVV